MNTWITWQILTFKINSARIYRSILICQWDALMISNIIIMNDIIRCVCVRPFFSSVNILSNRVQSVLTTQSVGCWLKVTDKGLIIIACSRHLFALLSFTHNIHIFHYLLNKYLVFNYFLSIINPIPFFQAVSSIIRSVAPRSVWGREKQQSLAFQRARESKKAKARPYLGHLGED